MFKIHYKEVVINCDYELNSIMAYEKDLANYYCEDFDRFDLNEFFKIFANLCANVNDIVVKVKTQILANSQILNL
jgi:hypothetical protein